MNIELTRKALEKVGNPHVLVNIVSRRVRQLSSGGGMGRPLVDAPVNADAADIALQEIVEEKIGWEFLHPGAEAHDIIAPKKKRASRKAAAPAAAPAPAAA